ncbi:MAG: outer membrane beta-barrel protein [Acidobacteriota bacterium]|nr:outer membrane beta-barrel protein [Acidobacteriota bacterium]
MHACTRAIVVSAVLGALALPTAAAETGLYLNLKLGTTDIDTSVGGAFQQVIDGHDDSVAYEVGYRFSRHWAVQAATHDFGSVVGAAPPCTPEPPVACPLFVPVEASSMAYSLSLLPQLPLGQRLSIFGKIGLISWESELRTTLTPGEDLGESSEEDILWGLGARLKVFGPFEIFYEYEGVGDELETQAFGVSFAF